MKDKIEIKVSPRQDRNSTGFDGTIIKNPGLQLNVDDILIVGFQPGLQSIPKEFIPPSLGLSDENRYTNIMRPAIWTKSRFYSGTTNNLGIKNPMIVNVEKSIDVGGNPMLSANSPMWNHVTVDEGKADNYVVAYNVYEECVDAVLSKPGSGISSVQNFWTDEVKNLEIEKC